MGSLIEWTPEGHENRGRLFRMVCSCGCEYLHHTRVDVFERSREDSKDGAHVSVEGYARVRINDDMAGNPSARRDGIVIDLWCEQCQQKTAIQIAQHKGETLLRIIPPK